MPICIVAVPISIWAQLYVQPIYKLYQYIYWHVPVYILARVFENQYIYFANIHIGTCQFIY